VGSTWCASPARLGVAGHRDRAALSGAFRAPHKLKSAVGLRPECAEAQGKDFGIIATRDGLDVYVCGNGGMRPQHAVLLAESVGLRARHQYLDRFLMFYTRTADRLERTALVQPSWRGIDYLKSVLIDDALGICDDLEAEMQRQSRLHREWKATIEDPARVARFKELRQRRRGGRPRPPLHGGAGQKRPGPSDDGPSATPTGCRCPYTERPTKDAMTDWVRRLPLRSIYPTPGLRMIDGRRCVYRLADCSLHALSNHDPFSQANVCPGASWVTGPANEVARDHKQTFTPATASATRRLRPRERARGCARSERRVEVLARPRGLPSRNSTTSTLDGPGYKRI